MNDRDVIDILTADLVRERRKVHLLTLRILQLEGRTSPPSARAGKGSSPSSPKSRRRKTARARKRLARKGAR